MVLPGAQNTSTNTEPLTGAETASIKVFLPQYYYSIIIKASSLYVGMRGIFQDGG